MRPSKISRPDLPDQIFAEAAMRLFLDQCETRSAKTRLTGKISPTWGGPSGVAGYYFGQNGVWAMPAGATHPVLEWQAQQWRTKSGSRRRFDEWAGAAGS